MVKKPTDPDRPFNTLIETMKELDQETEQENKKQKYRKNWEGKDTKIEENM